MDPLLALDRQDRRSLQRQVAEHLRRRIIAGELAPGARLPASRDLAASLGVSRAVVVAAYEDLIAEGCVEGRRGAGTFVVPGAAAVEIPVPRRASVPDRPRWLAADPPPWPGSTAPEEGVIEFRPGRPTVALLPAGVWQRVWQAVAREEPPPDYGPPAGDPGLRAAIARYAAAARGVGAAPEDVVVTTGAVQAIDLVARATLRPGDAVGIEDPGPPAARAVFLARGARVVPLPVDEDGLRVDALPTGDAAPPVVYVTPSHQYPLGGRLPIARRRELLGWAREHDSLVVEDDYDSEFRFDGTPLPALAGLDEDGRVAYVGSFSKILTPALRTGYLIAPPVLRRRVEALKPLADVHTPWPVQRALATILDDGHLERHIRRMRRHYAQNRAALLAALRPVADLARPIGLEAGLQCCLVLHPPLQAEAIAAAARQRGVVVATLTPCYAGTPDREALLLGYGGLDADAIARGAAVLADVMRESSRGVEKASAECRVRLGSSVARST